jgi:hypothetical protein
MPYNLVRLWLVSLMFPNASIIYCRRDPQDTCFSCFAQNFAEGHQYSNDLRRLGIFYRYCEKIMGHWKTVLPARILDMQYEDLVHGGRQQIQRLLDFCGLDWNENCERFYETDRPVPTSSRVQVKQKMYSSSIGRWKPFEAHLKPLVKALNDFDSVRLDEPFNLERPAL